MAFGYKYWMVYLPEFNPNSFLLFVHNHAGSTKLRDYSRSELKVLGQPSWDAVRVATVLGETRFSVAPCKTTELSHWRRETQEYNSLYLPAHESTSTVIVDRAPEPANNSQTTSVTSGRAKRGSRRQLQDYVNEHQTELSAAVIDVLCTNPGQKKGEIRWVSPLAQHNYQEYRDAEFLAVLGLSEFAEDLSRFWPTGGPCWDALGLVTNLDSGRTDVILVEAKSHIPEVYGTGCQAGNRSRKLIEHSLAETKRWCGASQDPDWTGPLYQSANRLAHLYFCREVIKRPAWLINVYFLDDPIRPTGRDEWKVAILQVKQTLGLPLHLPYALDVFLPALRPDSDDLQRNNPDEFEPQASSGSNLQIGALQPRNPESTHQRSHPGRVIESNQTFLDWANRWMTLAQYDGAFVPDVASRIEGIVSLWREPIPGAWQRGIDPQLLGARYRRGDVGAPHPGEHSIEHSILCTEFDRVRCFGDRLLDGVAALPLVRDAGGARRANVEADLLLLAGDNSFHQLFVCEVKADSNNAWYAAVENLRQLRLLMSSTQARALFGRRNPALQLSTEIPVTGLVVAPQVFYSAPGKKANALGPTLELLATVCRQFAVDARLAVWDPMRLTIDSC